MFCSRKRPFPCESFGHGNEKRQKYNYQQTMENTQTVNMDYSAEPNLNGRLQIETDVHMSEDGGSNNNEQAEYDRNTPSVSRQQHCKQCLAGQGGHFMHIYSDSSNNR